LLLSAVLRHRAAVLRRALGVGSGCVLAAGLLAENLPATATAVERWDRQTDGWTSDRYIDPAPHTMQHWRQQYRQMLKNASAAKLYETVGH